METPDTFPTPEDAAADLRLIIQKLDRWERLPLRALRALPSVSFWQPPKPLSARYASDPNLVVCLAIKQRVYEVIAMAGTEEAQGALACLFSFEKPTDTLRERRENAAECWGVKPESFRTNTERKLLWTMAEELFRSELEWAAEHVDPALKP
jgi:hypothetical protein